MAGSASAVMGTRFRRCWVRWQHRWCRLPVSMEYLPMGFSILGFAVLTALELWTTPRKRFDYSADGPEPRR